MYGDAHAAEQALDFLGKALARGVGRAEAADDADLAGIREHPQFRRLISRGEPAPGPEPEKGSNGGA